MSDRGAELPQTQGLELFDERTGIRGMCRDQGNDPAPILFHRYGIVQFLERRIQRSFKSDRVRPRRIEDAFRAVAMFLFGRIYFGAPACETALQFLYGIFNAFDVLRRSFAFRIQPRDIGGCAGIAARRSFDLHLALLLQRCELLQGLLAFRIEVCELHLGIALAPCKHRKLLFDVAGFAPRRGDLLHDHRKFPPIKFERFLRLRTELSASLLLVRHGQLNDCPRLFRRPPARHFGRRILDFLTQGFRRKGQGAWRRALAGLSTAAVIVNAEVDAIHRDVKRDMGQRLVDIAKLNSAARIRKPA